MYRNTAPYLSLDALTQLRIGCLRKAHVLLEYGPDDLMDLLYPYEVSEPQHIFPWRCSFCKEKLHPLYNFNYCISCERAFHLNCSAIVRKFGCCDAHSNCIVEEFLLPWNMSTPFWLSLCTHFIKSTLLYLYWLMSISLVPQKSRGGTMRFFRNIKFYT